VVTTPIRTIREMSQDVHTVRVMSEEVTHFGYFLFSKNENQIQINNQFPGIEKVVTKSEQPKSFWSTTQPSLIPRVSSGYIIFFSSALFLFVSPMDRESARGALVAPLHTLYLSTISIENLGFSQIMTSLQLLFLDYMYVLLGIPVLQKFRKTAAGGTVFVIRKRN
jgi:hypothetical protein